MKNKMCLYRGVLFGSMVLTVVTVIATYNHEICNMKMRNIPENVKREMEKHCRTITSLKVTEPKPTTTTGDSTSTKTNADDETNSRKVDKPLPPSLLKTTTVKTTTRKTLLSAEKKTTPKQSVLPPSSRPTKEKLISERQMNAGHITTYSSMISCVCLLASILTLNLP